MEAEQRERTADPGTRQSIREELPNSRSELEKTPKLPRLEERRLRMKSEAPLRKRVSLWDLADGLDLRIQVPTVQATMGTEPDELQLLKRGEARIRGTPRKLRRQDEEPGTRRQEETRRARTLRTSQEPISPGARIPLLLDSLSRAESLRRQADNLIPFDSLSRDKSLGESPRRQADNPNRLVRRIRLQEVRIAIRIRLGIRPTRRTHEVAVRSRGLK